MELPTSWAVLFRAIGLIYRWTIRPVLMLAGVKLNSSLDLQKSRKMLNTLLKTSLVSRQIRQEKMLIGLACLVLGLEI